MSNVIKIGRKNVQNYRSSFEGGYVYSGWSTSGTYKIIRVQDSTVETADKVTDLETDWTNKTTLTYT